MEQIKTKENICLIFHGDSREVLKQIPAKVELIVTSPPYADARKDHYHSIHPDDYAEWFFTFHESFWEILTDAGSLVLNIKDKIVAGVRHRFVWDTISGLDARGWFSIEDYIWHKPNPMPGFWPTRLRDGWEYCFHLAKDKKPYLDQAAVKIPVGDWVKSRLQNLGSNDTARHNSANNSGFGRNISNWVDKKEVLPYNVLTIPVVGSNLGHPAVFPIELPSFFIKLLSRPQGIVLDPFGGSGTTGIAALKTGRDCILIDNNFDYCEIAYQRILAEVSPLFNDVLLIDQQGVILKSNAPEFQQQQINDVFCQAESRAECG
ncbi:site-specific DNA-methyltransferase [candidate division KSB1 bacterium]|nr:site-specific DNA-methyltransferase [candidate division KSB1 bacterium]